MKILFTFLFSISFIANSFAQKTVQSGVQANIGISSPLDRWDKEFDVFAALFTDLQALSITNDIRLYNKPMIHAEFNYLRTVLKPYTWKIGLNSSRTSIERTSGTSYTSEDNNIEIRNLGAQAFLIRTFHPADENVIMIQLGIQASSMSLKNTELLSLSDTTDLFGITEIVQNSSLNMELNNSILIQGVARVEWMSEINENWSVSAAAEYRQPITSNTRFVGATTIENDFFPITTNFNTSDFSMPYWSFNLGIVRNITWKKQATTNSGL